MWRQACPFVLVFLTITTALRCHECTYFESTTDDCDIQQELYHLGGGTQDCKDAANQTGTLDCSNLTLKPGYDAWRCVHRDNNMTLHVDGQLLTVHLVSRDCEGIKLKDETSYKDGHCYHSDDMARRMQTMLQDFHPKVRMEEIHGHVCVCNTDNCNNRDPHYELVTDSGARTLFTYGTSTLFLLSVFAGQLFGCYATF